PRPVRVLLPRPAAGHPWPAVRTPPVHGTGRDAFLLRFEDQGRGALAPVLVGMGVAAAAAVPLGPLTIQPVSTSTRRWLRFRPRHRSGSAVEAGGMPRAGHGWPAAGTGSRMRIFRLGIPPASTAGSAHPPGAINRKPPSVGRRTKKFHARLTAASLTCRSSGADADLAADAGAADPAIAARILRQVLLVLFFRVVEGRRGEHDFGGDVAMPGRCEALLVGIAAGQGRLVLRLGVAMDHRAVLAADIVALAHALGRVMALPEAREQLSEGDAGGV